MISTPAARARRANLAIRFFGDGNERAGDLHCKADINRGLHGYTDKILNGASAWSGKPSVKSVSSVVLNP